MAQSNRPDGVAVPALCADTCRTPTVSRPWHSLVLALAAAASLAAMTGCSTSNDHPANSSSASGTSAHPNVDPGTGFGPALPGTADGDRWWLTSSRGVIQVSGGTPESIVRVAMSLVPTPCGPAAISLGGQSYDVKAQTPAAAVVTLDSSGSGQVPIEATGSFCQPRNEHRTLYALIAAPFATAVGQAGATVAEPTKGFYDRESDSQGYGYWMGAPVGVIDVVGKPGSSVTVGMALAPSPCGPSAVSLGGKKYDITRPTPVQLGVTVGPAGSTQIPITAANKPCQTDQDKRTLYAMVYQPKVL